MLLMLHPCIVTRDMVWKLGELQSVYNELQFNVETASPRTNLLKFCWLVFQQYGWVIQQCDAIGRLLHYTKNSLSSPCTSQHKHEQKDKTKTLVKFPDHALFTLIRDTAWYASLWNPVTSLQIFFRTLYSHISNKNDNVYTTIDLLTFFRV